MNGGASNENEPEPVDWACPDQPSLPFDSEPEPGISSEELALDERLDLASRSTTIHGATPQD